MKAVFKREFKAYFNTPLGFIVLAAYYLFLGIYFSLMYKYGVPDMANLILAMSIVVTFTVPIIT
ncbi:MAG: ABC transporter, partial [Clostridia bacterium]|nr:ABC transporter [Clostridia bacterium]